VSIVKRMHVSQSGVVLLEALIGILIFSMGILAMVALGATAATVQADAQYRTEAMNLAERISSAIWTGVDRTQTIKG
jgi:type IV pilus assembly protein PilV